MDVRISHPCTRDQDGNRLYNSSGEKDRHGKVSLPKVEEIMRYLVANTTLFEVHEEGVSWRFDPHGGSLDTVAVVVSTGSPRVCIMYNL